MGTLRTLRTPRREIFTVCLPMFSVALGLGVRPSGLQNLEVGLRTSASSISSKRSSLAGELAGGQGGGGGRCQPCQPEFNPWVSHGENWLPRVVLTFTPRLWNVLKINMIKQQQQKVKSNSSGLGMWVNW